MFLLWRTWGAFTALIATVLIVLATMSVLQHNAVLSQLVRGRLSVVVQSTASAFQTVVELGLPLSMMRNGADVLARARALDPRISAIHVFNPMGDVVHSTAKDKPAQLGPEIMKAQRLSNSDKWSVETDDQLLNGISVLDHTGTIVGGILAIYPRHEVKDAEEKIVRRISLAAGMLWGLFSLLTMLVLRIRLAGAIKGTRVLTEWLDTAEKQCEPPLPETRHGKDVPEKHDHGLLDDVMLDLHKNLLRADENFCRLSGPLGISSDRKAAAANGTGARGPRARISMASLPETSLARAFARHLAPWNIAIILLAVMSLGAVTFVSIRSSFDPELRRRTDLIAHVANADLQRAVSAGVPLEHMVGLESYFSDLLNNFPEVSYFGVATGKMIFQAGNWQHSILSNIKAKPDVPIYPIIYEEENIGYIIVDPNSDYIALQFREVLLDLAVVIFVVLLLANEIMVVVMSVSLTAPLDRLRHLARLQGNGDFSGRIPTRKTNVIENVIGYLSSRAEQLQRAFSESEKTIDLAPVQREHLTRPDSAGPRDAGLSQPKSLIFSYLSDIRLALFLFAAADELPLSFFPLFTRAADNPIAWLDPAVVISLPLAGYLLAYMLGAPFSRSLSEKWGHRKLLLVALVPVLVSNFGMYFATSVMQIIPLRTLAGAGYAFAALACQDYVIDVVPKDQRTRSMGIFSATLFGGIFAGTALGGVLADRFGTSTVFLVSGLLVMFSGVIFFRMIAPGRRAPAEAQAPLAWKSILQSLKNQHFFAVVFGLAIPQSVMDQVFISYLFSLQLDALGASAADISRMLMVYFLMIILSGSLLGWLTSLRIGNPAIVAAGSAVTGGALLLAAMLPSQWAMLLASAGTGFGHGLTRGPQVELAMQIAETRLNHLGSSSVLGALRLFERGGSVVGLLVLAAITGYVGTDAAIGAIGILILGGASLFILQYFPKNANLKTKAT